MGWQPILEGAARGRALGVVREIAEALARPGGGDGEDRYASDLALFWAYAAGVFDDAPTNAAYDAAVDGLVHEAASNSRMSLFGGVAGTAFVLAHVGADASDFLDTFDRALLRTLEVDRWEGHYDLIHGLVGLGVYLLERPASDVTQRGLSRIVDHLAAAAQTRPDGIAWHTPPEALPDWQRAVWPTGFYNAGLAHGAPGAIALLARIGTPRATLLARGAIDWVLAQRIDDERNRLPGRVVLQGAIKPARTAWCYGDPGAAIALHGATRRIELGDRAAAVREGVDDLVSAFLSRPFEKCLVLDAGFCHGAAGLAHLCNRFFQSTHEPRFRDASLRWFEIALALRQPGLAVAGFPRWKPDQLEGPTSGSWAPSASLLEGAVGIALALLAACEPSEPGWDRLLQCDV